MLSWVGGGIHLPLAYIILNLDPVLVHLGALAVHWYGLGYVVAICVGLAVVMRWARNMGIHEDQLWSIFIYTAIAGLIGGRLYYVVQQPDLVSHFLLDPINIIAVWNGGMAFFGAVFLGGLTLLFLAPRYGINRLVLLDSGAVFALCAQIFGRFGNLINGDILGQAATSMPINTPAGVCAQAPCIAYVADGRFLPWDIVYLNPHSFVPAGMLGVPFQPAPIYEMLCNIVAFALLFGLRYRLPRRIPGYFFACYLAAYAIGQFIVFFFRGSEPYTPFLGIDGLKQAQWTSIFALLISIGIMLVAVRVARPWTYTAKNPLPWPLPAGGLASLRAANADTSPRMPQPALVAARRTSVGAQPKAEDVSSRLGIALKATPDASDVPAWEPAHATHGRLRNVFG